jgi:serine/threonine protein kinase
MKQPPSDSKTVPAFSPGDRLFERYTLKKRLGAGGYGVVWLAEDEFVGDVALKILPRLATERDVVRDIRRELRNGLRLNHRNVVRVHDMAVNDDAAAISMEYVDGDTLLGLRLERLNEVFECADLLPYLEQLCAALTHAHTEAGVIHRDLKPSNVMVSSKGLVKVADFGISMVISETAHRITQCGFGDGTLPYMSPEQIKDDGGGPLLDVYALGATCYDLLTGKPPFYKGDVRWQILNKVPPLMSARREELQVKGAPIPTHWEDAISSCLEKDPNDRPATAKEVFERLSGCTSQSARRREREREQEREVVEKVVAPKPRSEREIVKLLTLLCALIGITALLVGVLIWMALQGKLGGERTARSGPAGPLVARVATPAPSVPPATPAPTRRPASPSPSALPVRTPSPAASPSSSPLAERTPLPSPIPSASPVAARTPAASPLPSPGRSPVPATTPSPTASPAPPSTPQPTPAPPSTPTPPAASAAPPAPGSLQAVAGKLAQFISNHLGAESELVASNQKDFSRVLRDYDTMVFPYFDEKKPANHQVIEKNKREYFSKYIGGSETVLGEISIVDYRHKDGTCIATFDTQVIRKPKTGAERKLTVRNIYTIKVISDSEFKIVGQKMKM